MLARITRPGVGAARRFEHLRGPEGGDRDALGGLGDHLVHVGHGGEVEHRAATLERVGERVLVEQVDLGPVGLGLERRPLVEHPHGVARAQERVDDVRADEPGAARDGDRLGWGVSEVKASRMS